MKIYRPSAERHACYFIYTYKMCELFVPVDDYYRHYSIFHFYNHDISLCLMQVLKRKFLEIAGADKTGYHRN